MTSEDATSPAQAFLARARESPDAPFLRVPAAAELPYAPDGFCYSYGEMRGRIEELRARFAASGYGHEARVALMLDNRPEFFWAWLALNALGIAILPLNSDLRAEDLAHQLRIMEPDLTIAFPDRLSLLRAADASGPIMAPDDPPPRCGRPVTRQCSERDDPCAMLFTSGSTGKPKCCVLSNDYFLRIARWYVSQGGLAAMHDGEEVVLTPLPMFHMNALACSTLGVILKGGTLVPLDRFHARRWWRTVADAGATVMHYLGVMPAILLKLDAEPAERAHRVRFGFGAGADPRDQAKFEQRFGFPLIEAWAMTETGAGAVTSTAGGPRHVGERCIGRPAPAMDFRIVDEGDRDVVLGTPGELLVRARGSDPRRGFFSGYLNDDAATSEVWAGGWFHTGDIVRSDGELLFFVDRKKNIVRRGGENIAVVEIEGVLESLADVTSAAVAPVPDEVRGEEVFALVRLAGPRPRDAHAGAQLAQKIARACAARLAYFKAPGYVRFVETLPVTATQKLQRGEVRAMAARTVGAADTYDLREFKSTLRQRDSTGAG